ncbi:MAG: hypothetical protein E6Q97_26425 [Desulfurellales bacterium]|nr:MAG: hypothetical protein E6Q97_26425 [Desulfurellales bacterium]
MNRLNADKPKLTLAALIVAWNEGRSAFWISREYQQNRAYAIGLAFRAGLKERELPAPPPEPSDEDKERPVWAPGRDPLPLKFALSVQVGLRT